MYIIRKIRGKELFSVKNAETGKIHSHASSKANAKKQVKLLQAIDHGFVPSKEHLEGAGFAQDIINGLTDLYHRATGSRRRAQVGIAPTDNPIGPYAPVNINGNQVAPEPTMSAEDFFRQTGGARLNPAVQTMLTYLKSLYPHKTLMSVANEILKLTGHKMTGRGRKSPTATEIAKYVIGAIGAALAIALAIFLLNNEIEEEKHYQNSLIKIESDRQRERQRMADEKREEINRKQVEDSKKRAADQIFNDSRMQLDPPNAISRIYETRIKPKSTGTGTDYRLLVDPIQQGGARLNPAVQSMITYLKSLYPHKTLVSVANEILKITGHKVGGIRGGKSTTASSIAMYVIKAIGTALAIAVAIFLLSDEDKTISQSSIHPRLDKVGPEQKDTYPYTPSYTPTTSSSTQKPDISLESLYGESSPSYTNMLNPGFGKVGRPKKKSDDYPIPSKTFTGNPRGYGRKKRLRKSKSTSDLDVPLEQITEISGGCFGLNCFRNRRRVAPIRGYPQLITRVINYVDRHPGQFNRIVYNWEHNRQAVIDDINERARVIIARRGDVNFLNAMYLPIFTRDVNDSQNLQDIPVGQDHLYNHRIEREYGRHGTDIGNNPNSNNSSSSGSSNSSISSISIRPPSSTGSGRKRRLKKKKVM